MIIDEAPEVIGEGHIEGSEIAQAISRLGRSAGISLLIASQTFKAEAVGSTTREPIVVGGTLIVLRVSKDASRLLDLPSPGVSKTATSSSTTRPRPSLPPTAPTDSATSPAATTQSRHVPSRRPRRRHRIPHRGNHHPQTCPGGTTPRQ